MEQKKLCRLTMEKETIDTYISQLPDEIIDLIFNRFFPSVPSEVAFQTCLLSKRWNPVLNTLPSVNLSKIFTNVCKPPKPELLNIVDNYLRRRVTNKVDIEKFTINVHKTDSQFASYMNKWVKILTRCNIKEIFFSKSHSRVYKGVCDYSFPQAIFFAKSLTSLHLEGCKLERKRFFDIKLVSLKRLVLRHVDISNETIEELIESCVVLEDLGLRSCNSLTTLRVAGLRGLNKLTLARNYNLETLEINEPSLLSFSYRGPYSGRINFANCRGLKELRLEDSDITVELLGEQLLLLEHLEDLKIIRCHEIKFLNIHHNRLKRLQLITFEYKRLEINIDAPNLQSFSLGCFCSELTSLSLSAPPTLEVNFDIRFKVVGPGLYINLLNILGVFNHSRLNLTTNLPNLIIPNEWKKCFSSMESVARFQNMWDDPKARLVDVIRSIYPCVQSYRSAADQATIVTGLNHFCLNHHIRVISL